MNRSIWAARYRQLGRDAAFLLLSGPLSLLAFYLVVPLTALGVVTTIIWVGLLLLVIDLSIAGGFANIARLHEAFATSPAPSAVFVPSAGEQGEELLTWWGRHHPETLTDPRVTALLPAWRRELTRLAPAFEAVPIHPLIHGDVVVTNVILGPDGVPRLIDFEWSGPGDRAKDLALIGGRVIGGPWYLPMTPDDVAAFVTEYSRYSRHAGAIDPQQLLARRDAYELLDRMGNLLYCLSRPGEARYGRWADDLARSLTARLVG